MSEYMFKQIFIFRLYCCGVWAKWMDEVNFVSEITRENMLPPYEINIAAVKKSISFTGAPENEEQNNKINFHQMHGRLL